MTATIIRTSNEGEIHNNLRLSEKQVEKILYNTLTYEFGTTKDKRNKTREILTQSQLKKVDNEMTTYIEVNEIYTRQGYNLIIW